MKAPSRRGVLGGVSGAALLGGPSVAAGQSSTAIPGDPRYGLFKQAGVGALTRSLQNKCAEVVSLTDFIEAGPGRGKDATLALHRAVDALPVGGVVIIPPGDWYLNATISRDNVCLRGGGGMGEFNRTCLKPFVLDRPTLQVGTLDRECHYCSLVDVHVSGVREGGGATVADSAPAALELAGGVAGFVAINSVFYGGVRTVSMVPSRTQPVTGCRFIGCTIRNDLTDSDSARAVYAVRFPDPGYFTANTFSGTKINGPKRGFALELDGRTSAMTLEFTDCYCDIYPDHGFWLRGQSTIVSHNLQLDSGTLGAVIIQADGKTHDPTRYILGMLRHGGQKMRFGDGSTIDFPGEASTFTYNQRLQSPFLGDLAYFTSLAHPYRTTIYYDFATEDGPMRWHGTQHRFTDTTDAGEDLRSGSLQAAGGIAVEKSIRSGASVHAATGYFVGGKQVLGARRPRIAPAASGSVVDREARAALLAILETLRAHGLTD